MQPGKEKKEGGAERHRFFRGLKSLVRHGTACTNRLDESSRNIASSMFRKHWGEIIWLEIQVRSNPTLVGLFGGIN